MWTWRNRDDARETVEQLVRCLDPGVEPAPGQIRDCGEGVNVRVLPDEAAPAVHDNRRPFRYGHPSEFGGVRAGWTR